MIQDTTKNTRISITTTTSIVLHNLQTKTKITKYLWLSRDTNTNIWKTF